MAYTFNNIQTRYLYLIGDTSSAVADTPGKSHINYAVQDICNAFPFSWNIDDEDLVLSAGTANLPTNYNPKWHLLDARIVNSGTGDDYVFTEKPISERDRYSDNQYIYWITFNSTTNRYVFNTHTQTGTVKIFYHFFPTDMSALADTCVVPDAEAVAYLAASKNWIGDERNQALSSDYEQKAGQRIQALWVADQQFGPVYEAGSILDYNSQLNGGSYSDDFKIARP